MNRIFYLQAPMGMERKGLTSSPLPFDVGRI